MSMDDTFSNYYNKYPPDVCSMNTGNGGPKGLNDSTVVTMIVIPQDVEVPVARSDRLPKVRRLRRHNISLSDPLALGITFGYRGSACALGEGMSYYALPLL
jgi:hypothetical protein